MFFVSGSRSNETDHGPILPLTCPHCTKVTYWRMFHNSKTTTVYFVPVANSGGEHKLVCDNCGYYILLNPNQVQRAHWIKQVTLAFFNKQITDEEYKQRLEQVNYLH